MGIIIKPIVTEKMTQLGDKLNRYGFRVQKNANKIEITGAIEKLFNVKVAKVNTLIVKGKIKRVRATPGKTADWKKAYVKLTDGTSVEELFGTE